MAYFQIPINGIYLFQWNIQVTYTTAFTHFYSNIANATTSTANIPVVTGVNWGQQQLGTVGGGLFMSTSGSFIISTIENTYYNLLLYISGGGTLSSISGYYYATRIG